jgi:hypothetical protein
VRKTRGALAVAHVDGIAQRMNRRGTMGPSEFESESLAPQARRMDQATPRPHAAPVAHRPDRVR